MGLITNECLIQRENKTVGVPEITDVEKHLLKKYCDVDFVTAVINHARFPSTQQGIIEALKIFDPKHLHVPADETITTYGEDAQDMLVIHYSNFINRNECQSEWDMLLKNA